MLNCADSFSPDYRTARSKFLEHANRCGGTLESIQHPELGPDGDPLTTDIARFGAPDLPAWIVLLSGTHGVEGFCGSGAQVDLLRRGEIQALPKGVGALMIHAVNPYGFAWLKRTTHENIDLNRNWVDFGADLPANDGYAQLADALCPEDWSPSGQAAAQATLDAFARDNGRASLSQAISGGQYTHPQGIFFGGNAPCWSRQMQTQVLQRYLSRARAVGIIDYHSGLGPIGFGERIVPQRINSDGFRRAVSWFGQAVSSAKDGSSSSADVVGDGLSAASLLLPHAVVTGIGLEFGTVSTLEVLAALRADAWLLRYGKASSERGGVIRQAVRDAFYVDRDDWKGMVAGQSLIAYRQAVAGLADLIGN